MTTGRMTAAVHAFAPAQLRRGRGCLEDALHAAAHRAGPRHFDARRRPPDMLHEVEQNFGVRQPVLDHFERRCIADDFSQFRQPGVMPPRKRTEPEHRTIERGEQQQIEIAVGDVSALMGQHGLALARIPIEALRRKQNGRAEGDGPGDHAAHAHAPVRSPGLAHRLGGTGQPPGQIKADRQPRQQQAGNERINDGGQR